MKLFNSIQELWNHCAFCPICNSSCRTIGVSVGPDKVFKLEEHIKSDTTLRLKCNYTLIRKRYVYAIEFFINCIDNSFKVSISDPIDYYDMDLDRNFIDKKPRVEEAYFYFYIQGHCPICYSATAFGNDLELDMIAETVHNIGLERESFYLLKPTDKYHLTMIYDRNVMLAGRCDVDVRGNVVAESDKTAELPLINIDLSNQDKLVDRIKTLILFS